jgi:hypothetical protein
MPISQLQPIVSNAAAILSAGLEDRPPSASFWGAYLNYEFYSAKNVWERVGGSLGTWGARNSAAGGDVENTCATRVSFAFSYSGDEIDGSKRSIDPGGFRFNHEAPAYNRVPGDDKWYVIRASTMDKYLRNVWGRPGYVVNTPKDLANAMSHLNAQSQQIAIFATPRAGSGHSGVLKNGYQDPYVTSELPVDVWLLP